MEHRDGILLRLLVGVSFITLGLTASIVVYLIQAFPQIEEGAAQLRGALQQVDHMEDLVQHAIGQLDEVANDVSDVKQAASDLQRHLMG